MTKKTQKAITGSSVVEIAEKTDRMPAGALDELFIEYYLETASMTEAYERACNAYGKEFKAQYAKQYGKALFDRLKERINNALVSADVEDKALGRMIIRKLAQEATSESVKGQMGTTLAKGLYPDVMVEKQSDTYEDLIKQREELDRLRH